MANYSKDMERQNKALKDLLSNKEHTKDYVQVGYEGKVDDRGGETRESELSKTLQKLRRLCLTLIVKNSMKKRLDRKFWNLFNHCMD